MRLFSIMSPLMVGINFNKWLFGLRGGDDGGEVPQASPTGTAEKAIAAQVESLPDILAAQQQYAPQFTQSELDLLTQFAPQFTEQQVGLQEQFGPRLAAAARESQRTLAPERIAAQELLASEFERPVTELLTPDEEAAFAASSRAATSTRGLGESGFGALEEIRGLTQLRNQIKQQRLNLALSATSGIPTVAQPTIATPNVSTGRLVQNVNPSQIFGLQQSNLAALQAAQQNQGGGGFSFGGAAGGALSGAAAGATIGSVVPGIGTGIGALVGGGIGAAGGGFS